MGPITCLRLAAVAAAAIATAMPVVAAATARPAQVIPCTPPAVCLQPPASPPIQVRPLPSPSPSPEEPGPIGGGLTPQANLQAVSQWVFGGSNWMVCQLGPQLGNNVKVSGTTCPDQTTLQPPPPPQNWFAPLYRRTVELAGLLLLPLLLLALLQALIRGDALLALKVVFGFVPLAILFSAIAVSITQSLIGVVDSFSDYMLNGYQGQLAAVIGSLAGVMALGAAGTAFTFGSSAAAVLAALAALLAVLAIVVELLARQAVIYAAVLFLPLGFASMVWPQLAHWTRRLVEVLASAILAKFVIVSVLVLGAAAFTSPQGGGPFDNQVPPGTTLLVGLMLVALAALAPVALLWMLPTVEAAVLAQFHSHAGRPMAAVTQAAERAVHQHALGRTLRQRVLGAGRAAPVVVKVAGGPRRPPRRPGGGRPRGGGQPPGGGSPPPPPPQSPPPPSSPPAAGPLPVPPPPPTPKPPVTPKPPRVPPPAPPTPPPPRVPPKPPPGPRPPRIPRPPIPGPPQPPIPQPPRLPYRPAARREVRYGKAA